MDKSTRKKCWWCGETGYFPAFRQIRTFLFKYLVWTCPWCFEDQNREQKWMDKRGLVRVGE